MTGFPSAVGPPGCPPSFSVLTLETTKLPQGRCPSWPPPVSWPGSSTTWGRMNGLSPSRAPIATQAAIKSLPPPFSAGTPFGQACAENRDSLVQDLLSPKTQFQISDIISKEGYMFSHSCCTERTEEITFLSQLQTSQTAPYELYILHRTHVTL